MVGFGLFMGHFECIVYSKGELNVYTVILALFLIFLNFSIVIVVSGSKEGMPIQSGITGTQAAGSNSSVSENPANGSAPNDSQKILSAARQLHHCNNSNTSTSVPERRTFDLNSDAEPERN